MTDKIAILIFLLGMLFGSLISLGIVQSNQPNCPTEDSCAYEYNNHHAKIVEVTP